MSKFYPRSMRRDSSSDHVHSLPDGRQTQGALAKPAQSHIFGRHSHMYEHEGKWHESGIADDGPGHVHESLLGETSGPMNMPAKEQFGPRNDGMDRIQKRGAHFVLINEQGMELGRGRTAMEAVSHHDADMIGLDYDEGFAKRAMGDVDEGLWEKAKSASQEAFGHVKWPFVQWWYQHQGGA
jgi:hypothetical protein